MKYFAPLALLAGLTALVSGSQILAPEPGVRLSAGETFFFDFEGTPLPNPEYTIGVEVKLDLDPRGPETNLITLGSVGYSPLSGDMTIPTTVSPGRYRLIAIEQLAYSFSGYPAYTRTFNQLLIVKIL